MGSFNKYYRDALRYLGCMDLTLLSSNFFIIHFYLLFAIFFAFPIQLISYNPILIWWDISLYGGGINEILLEYVCLEKCHYYRQFPPRPRYFHQVFASLYIFCILVDVKRFMVQSFQLIC